MYAYADALRRVSVMKRILDWFNQAKERPTEEYKTKSQRRNETAVKRVLFFYTLFNDQFFSYWFRFFRFLYIDQKLNWNCWYNDTACIEHTLTSVAQQNSFNSDDLVFAPIEKRATLCLHQSYETNLRLSSNVHAKCINEMCKFFVWLQPILQTCFLFSPHYFALFDIPICAIRILYVQFWIVAIQTTAAWEVGRKIYAPFFCYN